MLHIYSAGLGCVDVVAGVAGWCYEHVCNVHVECVLLSTKGVFSI